MPIDPPDKGNETASRGFRNQDTLRVQVANLTERMDAMEQTVAQSQLEVMASDDRWQTLLEWIQSEIATAQAAYSMNKRLVGLPAKVSVLKRCLTKAKRLSKDR